MQLQLDPSDLAPVIEAAVEATIARIRAEESQHDKRLAFSEAEAAALFGRNFNTLRDARKRGELVGSLIGKKIMYEKGELLAWLRRQRIE